MLTRADLHISKLSKKTKHLIEALTYRVITFSSNVLIALVILKDITFLQSVLTLSVFAIVNTFLYYANRRFFHGL